jgi:hypothetical protein
MSEQRPKWCPKWCPYPDCGRRTELSPLYRSYYCDGLHHYEPCHNSACNGLLLNTGFKCYCTCNCACFCICKKQHEFIFKCSVCSVQYTEHPTKKRPRLSQGDWRHPFNLLSFHPKNCIDLTARCLFHCGIKCTVRKSLATESLATESIATESIATENDKPMASAARAP